MKKKAKNSGETGQEEKETDLIVGAVEPVGEKELEEDKGESDGSAEVVTGPQCAPTDTTEQLAAAIEAILFAMGDAVEIDTIAKALEKKQGEVKDALTFLQERYNDAARGITLQYFDNAVQLSTKTEEYGNLTEFVPQPKRTGLSDSAMETLAIIAYKQPITKGELEQIRGVSSDYAVNKLLEMDLVREMGRKDAPGRPILFGTTENFLRAYGLRSLAELPSLSTLKTEEFREEAEAEVKARLGG